MLAVAVLAAGLAWRGVVQTTPRHRSVIAHETGVETSPQVAASTTRIGHATPSAQPAAAADSLRGTDIDGAVHVDASGRVIADRDLRRLFDYFLGRLGERTPDTIRTELQNWLAANCSPQAAAEALDGFDRYAALQRDSAALAHDGDMLAATAEARALRRARLGPQVADAWFGDDERYLDYTLAQRELASNTKLDPVERAKRQEELDSSLDPQRRDLRLQSEAAALAVQQSLDYANSGIDAGSRLRERAALYGQEAAERLAAMDQRQQEWQHRLADFTAQREQLLNDKSLNAAQRSQRLDALLAARFDENERRRVEALARNGLLPIP